MEARQMEYLAKLAGGGMPPATEGVFSEILEWMETYEVKVGQCVADDESAHSRIYHLCERIDRLERQIKHVASRFADLESELADVSARVGP